MTNHARMAANAIDALLDERERTRAERAERARELAYWKGLASWMHSRIRSDYLNGCTDDPDDCKDILAALQPHFDPDPASKWEHNP